MKDRSIIESHISKNYKKMKGKQGMKQPTINVILTASENRFTNQKEVKMDALIRVKNPA